MKKFFCFWITCCITVLCSARTADVTYNEKFKKLNPQECRNIYFFAKIYGSVRFFYPSSEVQKIDWDKFAVYGVRQVENCADDVELIQTVKNIFSPLCSEILINQEKRDTVAVCRTSNRYKVHEYYGNGKKLPIPIPFYRPYHNSVKTVKKGDTMYYHTERIDKNLKYTVPCFYTKTKNQKNVSFENLNAIVDTVSLVQADTKTRTGFINAKKRSHQIASLIATWNQLRFFYPYQYSEKIDWDSLFLNTLNELSKAETYVDSYHVFKKMLSRLNDGHVNLVFDISKWIIKGLVTYQNIQKPFNLPVKVFVSDTVIAVLDSGSPELRRGSIIDSVNHLSAMEWRDRQMSYMSGTKQRKYYLLEDSFFENYYDSVYHIRVTNSDGINENISITGNKKHYPYKPDLKPFIDTIDGNIHTFRFSSDKASNKLFKKTLKKLTSDKTVRGIIVDMRHTRIWGHRFTKYFSDTLMYSPELKVPVKDNPYTVKKYEVERFKVRGVKKPFQCPVVFIIDASLISYAEIVLSMMQHYGLGTFIGTPSAGVTGDVARFSNAVYNICHWTGMRVDKNNGELLFNKGIIPDIQIENSLSDVLSDTDRVFETAINVIKNGK